MLRILHAADLHLDSPFAALTPEEAVRRRRLQRQLPDRIVDLCHTYGCQLLLLAGDVFDGARVCPETVEALRKAFARCRAQIFIAPGNHDPYTDQSPWALANWPAHVHIFKGSQEAVTLPALGCVIHGGGFVGSSCHEPLQPVTANGMLQIGVFHGDPETPGPYRHLPQEAIRRCGLDYLALGHIHRPRLPHPVGRTWVGWPGVTMGRGFDECGTHGVFLVTAALGTVEAEFLPLANPRYETITVPAGEAPILPPDSETVICRMTLTGEGEDVDLETLHRQLAPRFLHLELRDETQPPRDLWAACGDGTLRGLALSALQAQENAALAARYLLAALEGRDAP